jgi:hypothetical protein
MKLLQGEDSRILLVLALDEEWAMNTPVSLAASLPCTRAHIAGENDKITHYSGHPEDSQSISLPP